MKLIKYTAVASLLTGVASAQGLFDVNSNETEGESSPLKYTAGVAFGYDDNVSPTSAAAESDSTYVRGNVGASLVVRGAQTSWDISAGVGVTNYLDDIEGGDDTTYNANLALNINHRLNDRTRLVSRNFFNYGLDLGNFYGPITSRQVDEYVYFSTDNAIGYRWTDRLATYTGVAFSTLNYDDGSQSDVDSYSVYNQFRYTLSDQTVLTATGRYTYSDYSTGDSDRTTASVGFEHRLSESSTVAFQVGGQFGDNTSAYANLSYTAQINNQLKIRTFARYSQEDTDTVFIDPATGVADRYEDKTTLRIGAAADYTLSPQITLTAGGSYITSDYSDATTLEEGTYDLYSVYLGATYKINEALSVTGSANFTDSRSGVIPNRDYNRRRYEVGVNYAF